MQEHSLNFKTPCKEYVDCEINGWMETNNQNQKENLPSSFAVNQF